MTDVFVLRPSYLGLRFADQPPPVKPVKPVKPVQLGNGIGT